MPATICHNEQSPLFIRFFKSLYRKSTQCSFIELKHSYSWLSAIDGRSTFCHLLRLFFNFSQIKPLSEILVGFAL